MLEEIKFMPALCCGRERGFTLNELLVVVAIVAILSSLAVPTYQWAFDKYRLKGAADTLRGDLQYARLQAISNNKPVFVSFAPAANMGSSWCYGMILASSGVAGCNCKIANSCTLKQVSSSDFTGVTLAAPTSPAVMFAANLNFDPVRGLVAPASGAVEFLSTLGKRAQLNLSVIGKAGICDPAATGSGYPSCY
jgi:prepilin-type N-terminal cleavage/methylation domain-containing protein